MGVFRFKRFEVVNERSAMKVNTDGVLLGALMSIEPSDRNLLDIGTGTGTIALMAAQRLSSAGGHVASFTEDRGHAPLGHMATGCSPEPEDACIQAIDIDEASATEAAANFRNSGKPQIRPDLFQSSIFRGLS